jgi:2-oxoglutarate ferredoxin oxidoreductase subunit alpha
MTPSSTILHTLADLSKQTGMIVRHAEDEIAVMNMCIGASFAGARAMCATSGGGFALMNEALGLAGITETPLVAVEVQRPGPATGLPTWHGQADLQFVLNSAQGEFPRVVIAPGDPEECFYLTSEAFNLADKFQTPVIVLSDKYLGESDFTVNKFDESKLTIDRGELLSQKDLINFENYKRYKITPSGVSKRSVPGMRGGRHLANSDEHDEFGFTSEEAKNATDQMQKRMRKEEAIRKILPKPKLVGPKNADVTFVSWGSTKGAILEAIQLLSKQGIKANFLQIKYIWPFQSREVETILKSSKKLVLIEGNYNGQLGRLIAQETGIRIKNKILKYDGRPISADEIFQKIAD